MQNNIWNKCNESVSIEGDIYSKGGSILVDGDTTSCKGALSPK